MSLLASVAHQGYSRAAHSAMTIADYLELGDAEHNLAVTSLAIDEACAKISSLLDRGCLSAQVDTSNSALKLRDRLETRIALQEIGFSDEETESMTLGFESAGSQDELGFEAWLTIKKAVTDIINWVIAKLEEGVAWILKVFNKYFGAFESQRNAWKSLAEKADAAQNDGKVIVTKEKYEATSSVPFYTVGGKQVTEAIINAHLKTIKPWLSTKVTPMIKADFSVPAPADLLVDGGLKPASEIYKLMPVAYSDSKNASDLKSRPGYNNESALMIGEVRIFSKLPNISVRTTAAEMETDYKAAKVSILPDDPKAKVKESIKLEYFTAAEVSSLADQYQTALDLAIDLVRGDTMKKMSKSLAKASSDLKGWAKDVPSEDGKAGEKAAYRMALSLVTSWLNLNRRLGIQLPNAIAKHLLSCSQAHYNLAAASIREHKKPE